MDTAVSSGPARRDMEETMLRIEDILKSAKGADTLDSNCGEMIVEQLDQLPSLNALIYLPSLQDKVLHLKGGDELRNQLYLPLKGYEGKRCPDVKISPPEI